MARINITLDQDEVLRLLGEDSGAAMRALLQEALNGVLRAESDEQIGAARYERGASRRDSRNGTRERPPATRVGTVTLAVPRHRDVPFRTLVFDNYCRSEAALVTTMAEMVVAGVSTAKVGRVMGELCGRSFSKQAVSEACAELDAAVEELGTRPIASRQVFAMFDATYVKVREGHRVRPKALMVALGLNEAGRKEVLGVGLYDGETEASWSEFLRSLRDRGLSGMAMVTSDAHEGLVAAVQSTWPDVPWQRCQAHLARNVSDAAPKSLRAGLRSELSEMSDAPDLAAAAARRDEIARDYRDRAPRAVDALLAGFDDSMSVMELPAELRRVVRTSNYLERLNREVKRRSRVVGVFPSGESAVRLVGAMLMEEGERWAASRRHYWTPSCARLDERAPRLAELAREQRRLRAAS